MEQIHGTRIWSKYMEAKIGKMRSSANRQSIWSCAGGSGRSGGTIAIGIGQKSSGQLQAAPKGDLRRRRLRRPLAILTVLILLLLQFACGNGGSSDNSSSNGNNNGNGNNDNLPGAPTSLDASAAGTSQINLTWQAPADDGGSAITGYQIEYRQGASGDWSDLVDDTDDTETEYEHSGLTPATDYSYRVSAINANGTGPASNVAMEATVPLGAPGAPTNLAASANGPNQVDLSWEAPADDGDSAITGYRIEYRQGTGLWSELETDTGDTETEYEHTGLTPATTYSYRISAINAVGTGPASQEATATTDTDIPGAPIDLEASASGSGQINLSWDAPASDGGSAITGYQIEYREGSDAYSVLVDDTGNADTEYSHTGRAADTSYSYRVSAINAVGTGPASQEATATTEIGPPRSPTNLAASANGYSQIQLSWDAPASNGGSAITGYWVEYREGAGDWSDLVEDTGNAETDYDHNGLTAATDYSYRIYAINALGTSLLPSEEATARTAALADDDNPGVPTNFKATPGEAEVTLNWTDPVYCGAEKFCNDPDGSGGASGTNHQHYLEYKLSSADDSAWANGQEIPPIGSHAGINSGFTLAGQLTGGMEYDFRLAIQLTGPNDRGPWTYVSGLSDVDTDGDGTIDSLDTDDDNDGALDTSDAFPKDACASVDSDGDGQPNAVLATGDTAPGGSRPCSASSSLKADIDDDNDGLIEIAEKAELSNMRYDLAGGSYDDEADDSAGNEGNTNGAPTAATTNCDTASGTNTDSESIYLCGYELSADIDLGGTTSVSSDDPPDISCESNQWTPIGSCGSNIQCGEASSNDDNPFTATFEGNGFTISNLCIETPNTDEARVDVLGLFGHLGGATVRNLEIAEVYIESNAITGGQGADFNLLEGRNRIGSLAGYVTGSSTIFNVAATDTDAQVDLQALGDIETQYVGGLIGRQEAGAIIASSAAAAVNGTGGPHNGFGGLVGRQAGGTIIASYASGSVSGQTEGLTDDGGIGGLVGGQDSSSIAASYATGTVDGGTGGGRIIGGLVGYQGSSSITASYATGAVDGGSGSEGGDSAGGLVGIIDEGSSITASFATGAVDGAGGSNDRVGRLAGLHASNGTVVSASYGFGDRTGGLSGVNGSPKPGGVTEAADLTGNSGDATTYAGAEWSATVWDFGDSGQAPALRYISDYMRGDGPDGIANSEDDTHSYICDNASFPAALAVTCATTLLPGPDGSPQDRE